MQFAAQLRNEGTLNDKLHGPRDLFASAELMESADGRAWAVTVLKAHFAALPERDTLRFALYNTTLWSAPSFEAATAYIERAMQSARAGEVWMHEVGAPSEGEPMLQQVNRTLLASLCAATAAALLLTCAIRLPCYRLLRYRKQARPLSRLRQACRHLRGLLLLPQRPRQGRQHDVQLARDQL